MGKYAVITLNFILNNDELYSLLRQVCVPSIRAYAKRMRYDFILMNNNTDKYTFKTKQLQCLDFLDYYDKILYIDGDCYIHKLFCIDLFNKTRNKNMGITFNTTSTYHAKKGGGDDYIKYPFVIFITNRVMARFIKNNLFCINDIISNDELLLNYIIESYQLEITEIPYLTTNYFISKYKNKIIHLWCNRGYINKYRKILIQHLRKLRENNN